MKNDRGKIYYGHEYSGHDGFCAPLEDVVVAPSSRLNEAYFRPPKKARGITGALHALTNAVSYRDGFECALSSGIKCVNLPFPHKCPSHYWSMHAKGKHIHRLSKHSLIDLQYVAENIHSKYKIVSPNRLINKSDTSFLAIFSITNEGRSCRESMERWLDIAIEEREFIDVLSNGNTRPPEHDPDVFYESIHCSKISNAVFAVGLDKEDRFGYLTDYYTHAPIMFVSVEVAKAFIYSGLNSGNRQFERVAYKADTNQGE